MLRTNLSTRPFYNERAVHVILAGVAVVVLALTLFNLTQIVLLSRKQSGLSNRAAAAETQAQELRAHAAKVRQGIDTKQLSTIAAAAREANGVIGQRLFSWTELLNRLETTLPDDVRITSLRPRVEGNGAIMVVMTVSGRRVDEIERFMQNLDATGAFAGTVSREELTTEDGLLQVTIEGKYR